MDNARAFLFRLVLQGFMLPMSDNAARHLSTGGAIDDEFSAAITSAVLVDRSVVGKLLVTGADRLDLLHRLSTNNLLDMKSSSGRMTVFTTDKGRIVDYVRVLALAESLMLVTSPGQDNRLMSWIDKYTMLEDIQVRSVTSQWAMFSIVGREAEVISREILGQLLEPDAVVECEFAGTTITVDCRRDLSIPAVNILAPNDHAPTLWARLTEAGKEAGIRIMSTQGYECLRIFHGTPREECELTAEFNPYEAGLRHAISFSKGCYIGQEVIARLDTYQKIQRKLVRLRFDTCLPDFHLPTPLSKDGVETGILTSFAPTPLKGEYIALGIVRKEVAMLGDTLFAGTYSSGIQGVVTEIFDRNLI